ncbi:MAG: exosortase/archaeosortase family protein [Phycisphaerales bacterium]|nr:exosortase/archaeosortase family protein [Phycisphaerales bacterium]
MSRLNEWRSVDLALLVGLTLLAVASCWPVWREIFSIATHSPEDSQILLAAPVAVWLAWLRRGRLRACGPSWSWFGPVLIIFGAVLERAGEASATEIARHAGIIAVALGAMLTVLGVRVMVAFLPALLALAFLMPVPGRLRQQIAVPLQEISAHLSQNLLDLFGFAVERSGNLLIINGEQVAVAEACNGMRMVSALALLSFAFVFSVPMRHQVRVLLLVASPVVALVVNIVRLVPTVLAYGHLSPGVADLIHDVSGWAVLGLAVVLLWGLLLLLRWFEVPIDPYPVERRESAR